MNYINECKQEHERVKKMSGLELPMEVKRISEKEQKELMSSITGYSDVHVFKKCHCPDIPADLISKSGSRYWYIKEDGYHDICVIRKSKHWGYIKDFYWHKEKNYDDNDCEEYTGFIRLEKLTK